MKSLSKLNLNLAGEELVPICTPLSIFYVSQNKGKISGAWYYNKVSQALFVMRDMTIFDEENDFLVKAYFTLGMAGWNADFKISVPQVASFEGMVRSGKHELPFVDSKKIGQEELNEVFAKGLERISISHQMQRGIGVENVKNDISRYCEPMRLISDGKPYMPERGFPYIEVTVEYREWNEKDIAKAVTDALNAGDADEDFLV